MEILPRAGLAVDPHARPALQALDELVADAGIRQRRLHHCVESRAEERVAREQVVEPGDLEGRCAVGKAPDRVAPVGPVLAVGLAHPETPRARGVVEPVTVGLEDLEQPIFADPAQHARRIVVARVADHVGHRLEVLLVEREPPGLRLRECAEQDGHLREARRVHHVIAVQHRKPRGVCVRGIDQRKRESPGADFVRQPEIAHDALEPALQPGIERRAQVARGRRVRARRSGEREQRDENGGSEESLQGSHGEAARESGGRGTGMDSIGREATPGRLPNCAWGRQPTKGEQREAGCAQ